MFRRGFSPDRNSNAIRLAGRIFEDSDLKTLTKRELRQSLQRSRPVGFGFGERHPFGPDDDWSTRNGLSDIHDQDHYIVGESHGFDSGGE